jgi:hypothetical protein
MDIATIVLTISTALGGGGTIAYWLETHSTGRGRKRAQELETALAPVKTDLQELHLKFDTEVAHSPVAIEAVIARALEPLRDQLSVLNTKVEPLWAALITMAGNQINVLHQPDPARHDVDVLLDALREEINGGPLMSSGDYLKLRHCLKLMKTWEPGTDVGFPVSDGDRTAAAILLATMGLSRQKRRQENRQ